MNAMLTTDDDGLHRKRQKIATEGLNGSWTGISTTGNGVPLCTSGKLPALFARFVSNYSKV